jgi:hypothetical protein
VFQRFSVRVDEGNRCQIPLGITFHLGHVRSTCRFLFQKEKNRRFLYPAGELKKVEGGGSEKKSGRGRISARLVFGGCG